MRALYILKTVLAVVVILIGFWLTAPFVMFKEHGGVGLFLVAVICLIGGFLALFLPLKGKGDE